MSFSFQFFKCIKEIYHQAYQDPDLTISDKSWIQIMYDFMFIMKLLENFMNLDSIMTSEKADLKKGFSTVLTWMKSKVILSKMLMSRWIRLIWLFMKNYCYRMWTSTPFVRVFYCVL